MLSFSRYKRTRFWAVYEGDTLLCVTVYRRGALSIVERITGTRPELPTRTGSSGQSRFPPPDQIPESVSAESSL